MSGQDRVILTPEHVEIRLAPAGLGSRFLALLIDGGCWLALAAAVGSPLVTLLPEGVGYALAATMSFAIAWGYHVYFELRHDGRTPGKRMVGLRVVDGRGLALATGQSFARNVLRALDWAPAGYGLGAAVAQLDPLGRRLGDLAADTLVVAEGRSAPPPAGTARSKGFDSLRAPRVVRLVRHRIGIEERELLLALCVRAERLEPRARFDLFEDVAAHYRSRLELDDVALSGENLVRGIASLLFWDRRSRTRRIGG